MAGDATRDLHEELALEEADAWFEYLDATRAPGDALYEDVEPWAWARLKQRLRAVTQKRARLRSAAA
jgi:hypothetical protein